MPHQGIEHLLDLSEDVLDIPMITDSRNLPAHKHELLKKISKAAKENECFADDAYRANGEIDIGLEQFEPLAEWLNKPWKEDRFSNMEPDWMFVGHKRWTLLMGGDHEQLVKKRPSVGNGKPEAETEEPLKQVKVYVTIDNGLMPNTGPWGLSFVEKDEIPKPEDLPANIMGKQSRGCVAM